MKTCRESVLGICGVSLLIGAGLWYADSPETGRWSSTRLGSGGESEVTSTLVRRIEWSADGQTIISLSQGAFGSGECLALHDAVQGSGAMPIGVAGEPVGAIAWGPDPLHLAVATWRGKLLWIDLESSNTVVLVDDSRTAMFTAAAISADGRLLAAAAGAEGTYVCSLAQGTVLTLTARRQSSVAVLYFSRDGRRLVGAYREGSICHWDLATHGVLNEFPGNGLPITAVAFLPGDQQIISAGLDGTVRIHNLDSGHEEWRVEPGHGGITSLAVSSNGRTAAWGGYDHRIVVWDLELKEQKFEFTIPAPCVTQLKFTPDGTTLAVAGPEPMIRLYDMQSGTEKEGIDVGQNH